MSSTIEAIMYATDNGRDLFNREVGTEWKPGKNLQNPWAAKQQTPSLNIYYEGGVWRFNDFATGDKGDGIDFVMKCHRLPSIGETLAHIERELGLVGTPGNNDGPRPAPARHSPPPTAPPGKLARQFAPVYRDTFSAAGLAFWGQSGIRLDVLKKFGVRELKSYTATRADGTTTYTARATAENLLFAYDAGHSFAKVYAPLAAKPFKFTWPTGQPTGYVFGLGALAEWQSVIVLAAGEKDAMTLSAHGYAAVTVGSETADVSAALVAELRGRCDDVLVLYDADETGRRRGAEIAAAHGLRHVELPAELAAVNGKDATDFYRAVYGGHLKNTLLDEAFTRAFATPPTPPPAAKPAPASPTRLRTVIERLNDAKTAAPLRPLLGPFWEAASVAILCGEPGAAKTLLALHVAHAVSSATPSLLGLVCDANEKTLYYDLELTDRQFDKRMGAFPDFTENLIFGDYNPDGFDGAFTFAHIAADLEQTGAKLLIIDNITALSMKSTADADAAMSIMRGLKELQREKGISSLVIAHPPKLPAGVPLSMNHIGGKSSQSGSSSPGSAS